LIAYLFNSGDKKSSGELASAEEFKLYLYKKWIEHLKGFRGITDNINLCLKFTADEGEKGSQVLDNVIDSVITSVKDEDEIKGCILEGIKEELKISLRKATGIGDEDYFPDTLPPILRKEKGSMKFEKPGDGSISIIVGDSNDDSHKEHSNCICYRRHEPVTGAIFSENLSGAANHYPILVNPPDDLYYRQKLIYQMVENGLLRIAVADERIVEREYDLKAEDEFYNQHIKLVYGLNDYQAKVERKVNDTYIKIDTENNGVPDDIDILIIHQGILDSKIKWTGELTREGFIEKLKEKIPFIVITSGRGKPDIPQGTKFLSFSIIEECLLSRPISKFILTQTLLSLKEKKRMILF